MKKILTSYIISFPLIVIGIVFLVQASSPSYLISADQALRTKLPVASLTFIAGAILIILGVSSIVARFVTRSKE